MAERTGLTGSTSLTRGVGLYLEPAAHSGQSRPAFIDQHAHQNNGPSSATSSAHFADPGSLARPEQDSNLPPMA
jgi:hypothetical protein